MPNDDDRPFGILASKDERIQSYLRTERSTEDIVREITAAFAHDVARIMAAPRDGRARQPKDATGSARRNRNR